MRQMSTAASTSAFPKRVWIVNCAPKFSDQFATGKLNTSIADIAAKFFTERGATVDVTNAGTADLKALNVPEELAKAKAADLHFYASPTYWMGLPGNAKAVLDLLWTSGMDGTFCTGDGRRSATPQDGYGTAGVGGKSYSLALTFNAPEGAFLRKDQYLFEGGSVDDLWRPFHINQKFFSFTQRGTTFAQHDIVKNPTIEANFVRFNEWLATTFPQA